MVIQQLDIAVIGDEELVNAMRLAGVSKYYTVKDDHDVRDNVREALTDLLAGPDIGIVIMLEDFTQYVEDLVSQIKRGKGTTPVIVEVPSKSGTKYPDIRKYYSALIRESIGFEVEI